MQEQSALFRLLPGEVRALIWEATIGERRISLTMLDRHMRQGSAMRNYKHENIGLIGDKHIASGSTYLSKMVCVSPWSTRSFHG